MWNRSDLKYRAKAAIKKNYWAAVIVAFIMVLVSASSNADDAAKNTAQQSAQTNYTAEEDGTLSEQSEETPVDKAVSGIKKVTDYNVFNVIWIALGQVALFILIIFMLLFGVLIGNVLMVGGTKFFIENRTGNPKASRLFYGFRCGHYWNIVKTMLLTEIYIVLWTLLLIVPGIIKTYEYRMVPYILAEHPEMESREVIALSREMMNGEKMNAFVLDFSFIPWLFLSSLTFGIAGIFFVEPYIRATDTELFAVLAGEEIPNDRIS
ncbi:MAG: DUF975 family protein [Blautia sp.]|nr:DUF975 family protein [Blautia sp.]